MSNGLLLRPAAAALGISRRKLLRFIEEGLPVARKGERVFVDIEEARAWIQLNEEFVGESAKLAPVLHPDDPRHRERTAAAKIAAVELALQRGELLRTDDVRKAVLDETVTLRGTLSFLHRYLGAEVGNANGAGVKDAVAAALAEILKPFQPDAPQWFPNPQPAPESEYDFEGHGERETLPRLASGDPRYDYAVTQMQKREAELAALLGSVIPFEAVRDFRAKHHAIVLANARTIPAAVAKKLGREPADRTAINDAVDASGHAALWAMHADFGRQISVI